ncbi:MAG: hypothetical protein WCV92_03445 [Candidatus Buchananbacteria bacterium]
MACLITPATAAIITTIIRKKIPQKYHLDWLMGMLWGGTIMLVVDHFLAGEILLYPPFLTATQNPVEMLRELAVTGGLMTAVIFLAWIVMALIANKVLKRHQKQIKTTVV